MIVHKFGGTSVGDAERMDNVAAIIASSQNEAPTVVVVSAIQGVTDRLIEGARAAGGGNLQAASDTRDHLERLHEEIIERLLYPAEARAVREEIRGRFDSLSRLLESVAVLGELTARGHDAVVGYGEHLSATILAATLQSRGTAAEAVSATELIVTDDRFGAAKPKMDGTYRRIRDRLMPSVEAGVVPIITGYIGATEAGVPTTLGRSGSDFSAAIVASGLVADELLIWTDVDGILTADPNVVPNARVLRELSYEEAARLARFGAEVLHPRTIAPVIQNGIPLRIINSFNPTDPGTRIVNAPDDARTLRPAIISAEGLSLLRLGGCNDDWRPGVATRALHALSDAGIEVLLFSQSFSEPGMSLVVREVDARHAVRVLHQDGEILLGDQLDVATISVIGFGQASGTSFSRRAFAALGDHGVPVLAVTQAADDESLSLCVPGDRVQDTVRYLHTKLDGESPGDHRAR